MKVTIKLKQGMYDDKIMTVTQWLIIRTPECGVPIAHRARSRENYVTTGNGLKMASTAAYNLWDNHRYSIANL